MRQRLTALLLLLLITMSNQTSLAQNADVKGWGNTTWGMSEDQLIKLYPAIKRISENRLTLSNIVIGMSKYEVILVMDRSKKLKEVFVAANEKDMILKRQFDELEKELSLKYGPPALKNRPSSTVANEAVSAWTFPSTTIELSYVLMRGLDDKSNVNHLIIRYRPNISKGNL